MTIYLQHFIQYSFIILASLLWANSSFAQLPPAPLQVTEGWSIWYNQQQFISKDIPPTLVTKQQKIVSRPKVQMRAMSLAPDGGWILAYLNTAEQPPKSYLSYDGPYRKFLTTIKAIDATGVPIKQMVTSPLAGYQNQSWVVLYGNNDAHWKNIAPNLIQTILDVRAAGKPIHQVALSINGGWVLLAGENEVYSELIPENLRQALQQLQKGGHQLQQVVFNVDNGWIITYDNNRYQADKVPSSLLTTLNQLAAQDAQIHQISFYTIKGRL